MRIKSIKGKSLAKVLGLLYFFTGIVIGLLLLIVLLVARPEDTSGFGVLGSGVIAPILLSLVYGVMGYVMGFFIAWVYNFIAKKFGGIEIETE